MQLSLAYVVHNGLLKTNFVLNNLCGDVEL